MKKNIAILILCLLVAALCVRGQVGVIFYKEFVSGLYYRDSAHVVRKANTLELSNLNKLNHNQAWADSVFKYTDIVWTDTIQCDRIYFDKQTWTVTNSKVAPVPMTLKVVKWIRGVVYPDGLKWFADDGTFYNVIWYRLKTSLIWAPVKTYQ